MPQQMKITQVLEGRPFMTEYGIVGYSSVVLIQEEGKNILYDCGSKGCALQLKEGLSMAGLAPEEITHVVISHLHFDHVGNLPLFQNAEILLSKTEWQEANYNPDEWHCQAACAYLDKYCSLRYTKEGDMLSANVQVLELPGHTLGLIGLKCGKDTILCSDAVKNRYEMWEDIPLMSMDQKKSEESRQRIRAEAAYIYPGHDQKLVKAHPINRKEIRFEIRYADRSKQVVIGE